MVFCQCFGNVIWLKYFNTTAVNLISNLVLEFSDMGWRNIFRIFAILILTNFRIFYSVTWDPNCSIMHIRTQVRKAPFRVSLTWMMSVSCLLQETSMTSVQGYVLYILWFSIKMTPYWRTECNLFRTTSQKATWKFWKAYCIILKRHSACPASRLVFFFLAKVSHRRPRTPASDG